MALFTSALVPCGQNSPLTQSIFPLTKTGNDSVAEGNTYELGMIFGAESPGVISQVRAYAEMTMKTALAISTVLQLGLVRVLP